MSRTYRFRKEPKRTSPIVETNRAKLRALRDEFAQKAGLELRHRIERQAEQREFDFAVASLTTPRWR